MKRNILIFIVVLLLATLGSTGAYAQEEKETLSQKDYHVLLLVDPVGFLTLGPSIQFEPILGKHLALNSGIRFQNLGLVSTSLFGSMDLSYGLQFALRVFPKPKNKVDRFFFGPGISYGRDNYKTGRSFNFRAFGTNLGYRWVFNNGFTLEIADLVGIVQSKQVDYGTDWITDMFVFYMLSVGVGIAF